MTVVRPPGPPEAARVRSGANPRADPNILRELADDESVTVRAAVALNPQTPAAPDAALAHDPDERVRELIARKLAQLAPSLSPEDRTSLQHRAWDLLLSLASDEATRVRAAIADVVKDMPDAPRELVIQLARDTALPVSEPVIRLSPQLTPEDLLALIANLPSPSHMLAVARRDRLDEAVADAVCATADSAAIRALLTNPTAQIREATLDALVAQAAAHPDWHEHLVTRPVLSPRAARLLSDFVAIQYLAVLAKRADLPPALTEDLHARLTRRLAGEGAKAAPEAEPTAAQVLEQAQVLAAQGQLTEEAVLAAARRGEVRYASAMLAVAAGLPVSVVDRAAALRSAKGLVSLVWKAGFSMRAATAVQTLLGRLSPGAALTVGPAGSFPLSVEEMRWQVEFLGRIGR